MDEVEVFTSSSRRSRETTVGH